MSHLEFSAYPGFGERMQKAVHYSQAVILPPGPTIHISGQGGWDRQTEAIPPDTGKQVEQAFENIQEALKQAGGKGWSQVYKVRCYITPQYNKTEGHITRNLRKYCPDHQPLLTSIGVQSLAVDSMWIEIEVEAHLGAA